jgi:hypothetical protein
VSDVDLLRKRLAEAEVSLAAAKLHVMKQEILIEQLERDGLDTTQAQSLLESFRASHQAREADRAWILAKLSEQW